jgi:hypothetical protein
MQSFETTLFSLSLERFPHALTSCVSALENLLRGFSGPHTRLEVLLRELWLTGTRTGAAFGRASEDAERDRPQRVPRRGQ